MKANKQVQVGLTVADLLVTLVIGLFLTSAVISLFLSNTMTYQQNEGVARIQEGARFIFQTMGADIRDAGGIPCGFRGEVTNLINNPSNYWWTDWQKGIRGFDASDLPANTNAIFGSNAGDRVAGTDAIMLHTATAANVYPLIMQIPYTGVLGALSVDSNHNLDIEDGDLVVACNFIRSVLLRSDSIALGGFGNEIKYKKAGGPPPHNKCLDFHAGCPSSTTPQVFSADLPAMVSKVDASVWYIGHNLDGNQSLYRVKQVNNGGTFQEEVSEIYNNVLDMQLEYLEETGPGVLNTSYTDADSVSDWSKVAAVRINITFDSNDENVPNYEWRRVISLRNLIL